MSVDLLAVLLTAGFQSILVLIGLAVLHRMSKTRPPMAALFLHGRRIEEAMREMRESLRRRRSGRLANAAQFG